MGVRIGHASIDENGNVSGGTIGDQTKKEICVRDWYSKPWNVYLECTDATVANKAATILEQICADSNYGYDQYERLTGYTSILKNGGKVLGGKGEFDCSSLVSSAYSLTGINISVANTTRSLRRALLQTGIFVEYGDSMHLTSGKYSKRGGIYLKEGSHVVMVLTNVPDKKVNPYVEPTTNVVFGETGISVRWVQWELIQLGYPLTLDGEFGSKTDRAVKDFQVKEHLIVDGIVGKSTRKALLDEQ